MEPGNGTFQGNERINMKKNICQRALFVLSMATALIAIAAQAADEDLHAESKAAVANFVSTDSSIQTFIDKSAGYAVFPNVGKGGLVVGGARGKGLLFENKVATGQAT